MKKQHFFVNENTLCLYTEKKVLKVGDLDIWNYTQKAVVDQKRTDLYFGTRLGEL